MVSASPPMGTRGSGPASASGCTRAAWCTSSQRHWPGSGPLDATAVAHAAVSAPGTAASTRSARSPSKTPSEPPSAAPAAAPAGVSASPGDPGSTGPPSSSHVSLASHRRTMVTVGPSAPDAIHSQVSGPSSGRYSASASARWKQAYSKAAPDEEARSPSQPASRTRAASADSPGNGPSPPRTRPHERAASDTVSACIPASSATLSTGEPDNRDRSRSARNGCANVYEMYGSSPSVITLFAVITNPASGSTARGSEPNGIVP